LESPFLFEKSSGAAMSLLSRGASAAEVAFRRQAGAIHELIILNLDWLIGVNFSTTVYKFICPWG